MPWLALLALLGAGLPAAATNPDPSDPRWIGSWSASPQPAPTGTLAHFHNQSLRLVVHTSAGGSQWRVRLSNQFGTLPLVIGSAHLARRSDGADIDPATDRHLTFSGRTSVTVPAHASVLSDPVALDAPALSDLAVSLHLPQATAAVTTHFMALQTSYVSAAKGDATAAAKFAVARKITSWPFLAGVEVQASPPGQSIVAFGDSYIDGDGSTADTNRRWPDALAERLQKAGATQVGVLNQGLIGNRLLRDSPRDARNPLGPGFGPSGLARFEADVLSQPGVACVIVRLGTNDIGLPGSFASPEDLPTAEQLIVGYRQLIARARQRGVRIVGSTLGPFEGADADAPGYYTPAKDALRQAVNAWIRHGGEFDALIDVDQILRDPAHPARLLPAYDSGDHLHPNDAGYAELAKAMPLAALGIE